MQRALSITAIVLVLVGLLRADGGTRNSSAAVALPAKRDNSSSTRFALTGQVLAPSGVPVAGATIQADRATAISDPQGNFQLSVTAGDYKVLVSAAGYAPLRLPVSITSDTELKLQLGLSPVTSVTAQVDAAADPSTQISNVDDLLPANPGQPGAPISLPGYPSKTASGGVKAPQYFAPGVAGDHGEPIAQYIQIGDFLFPNNLPANAHGNGYADPNLLIPAAIGSVQTDAGAFDVRHGNNAVNLSVAYDLRPRLEPFVQFTGDAHNYDVATGWSPRNPQVGAWLGFEVSGGDGFLALPEHRHQYKLNGVRSFSLGRHQLTLFAAGYYGSSRIPCHLTYGRPATPLTRDSPIGPILHCGLQVIPGKSQSVGKFSSPAFSGRIALIWLQTSGMV